jgi:nucleoside-diphosphate-sugar epimerase
LPVPKSAHARGPMRQDEVIDVIADISRAKAEFGWVPRVALRDGLRDTLAWVRRAVSELRVESMNAERRRTVNGER